MIAPDRVATILLAAGRSTRFGPDDKLLAALDGRPLALHAADILKATGAGQMIAACAEGGDTLAGLLAQAGFGVVRPPAGSGMGASLAAAISLAAGMDVDAALIVLADMPRVPPAHLAALFDAYDPAIGAIASTDGNRAMPPAVLGRAHFAALARLTGDEGARAILARAPLLGLDPALLVDIDTRADLAR